MNRTNIIIYIVVILLTVYFLQGVLYTSGGILSQILILGYLLICGFYFTLTIIKKKGNPVSNSIATLLITLGISFLLSEKTHYTWNKDIISSVDTYKSICLALLSFFPFYYFAIKGKIQVKTMRLIYFIWLSISITKFFSFREDIIKESYIIDPSEIVNNTGYLFVLLLPYTFLIKKRLFKVFYIILCVAFIVLASKRGAIITGAITLVIISYHSCRQSRNAWNIILIMCSIFVGYYLYESNTFLNERFTYLLQGYTSGRSYIYSTILSDWQNAPTEYQIFGQGFNSSIDIAGKFAHSDWLELLSSLGLIGVLIYIIFFWNFLKFNLTVKDNDSRITLMTILVIWFTITMFSMAYTNETFYILTTLLGYSIGNVIYKRTLHCPTTL